MKSTTQSANVISLRAYAQYMHSIKIAYRSMRLASSASRSSIPITDYEALDGLSRTDQLDLLTKSIKRRLGMINPNWVSEIFDEPRLSKMSLVNQPCYVPIANKEGCEWYENRPLLNYDFFVEAYCGMHDNARVIYDIGGHQGVWALYYSKAVGPEGKVYTFEPSIVNIEIAAMSFLINDTSNILIVPNGIGDANATINSNQDGLLISGVQHNVNILKLDCVFWEKPDFLKIDIEGYEHELMRNMPDLFEYCDNIHLEIHVPHLVNRNIDYRDIYRLIPFDKVRVRLARYGNVQDIGPEENLDGYCTVLITPI